MLLGFASTWERKKEKKNVCGKWSCNYFKTLLFLRCSSNKNYTQIKEKGGCVQGQLKNNTGQLLSNFPVQSLVFFWVPPPSVREGWCLVLVKGKSV